MNVQKSIPDERSPSGIKNYYKYLATAITAAKDKFHVTTALPLIYKNSQYDNYEIHQVPVPAPNASWTEYFDLEATHSSMFSLPLYLSEESQEETTPEPKGFSKTENYLERHTSALLSNSGYSTEPESSHQYQGFACGLYPCYPLEGFKAVQDPISGG